MLQFEIELNIYKYRLYVFLNFVKKWTTIDQLAKADFQEVSSYWAGLGYYSRAKNLHETAKIISNDYNSIIPCDKSKLLSLPGIGNYTASAIMAIAFDIKSNVIDSEAHPKNIQPIHSQDEVSHAPMPVPRYSAQFSNIAVISVTDDVSHAPIS